MTAPQLKTCRLTLHHVDGHDVAEVARALQDVARFDPDDALKTALRAYREGSTDLMACHLERAELLWREFAKADLDVRLSCD